jgi:site-specific DNA-methyltransferase (cytosine-N4-specific)
MSKTENPKANNRNILQPYSTGMQKLLKRKTYNAGRRPSQHKIGEKSFLTDNGGSIPPNVLTVSNTSSNDPYFRYCRANDLPLHPARMPISIPEFFIKFLTDPKDIVLDPFAGSNTTGAVAEKLKRQWISIEAEEQYIEGSKGRFTNLKGN